MRAPCPECKKDVRLLESSKWPDWWRLGCNHVGWIRKDDPWFKKGKGK